MSTNNKIKSTRKHRNRSQRRRKNGSAYTIRRGGFLTPFRNRVKQRFTAFRQRRAAAATVRARESQARIDGNVSPRFRTSPGRWFRTRFQRNRSNAANPPLPRPLPPTPPPAVINPVPAFVFDESIYTHVVPDGNVIRHYSDIFSERSAASLDEKDQAIKGLKKYLKAVDRNARRNARHEMREVNAATDEASAGVNAIHEMLSRVTGGDISDEQLAELAEEYGISLDSNRSSHSHSSSPSLSLSPSFSPSLSSSSRSSSRSSPSEEELQAYLDELSSPQNSHRSSSQSPRSSPRPQPPAISPAGFVRRSRSGSNKKK
jgi:hypothetical protein